MDIHLLSMAVAPPLALAFYVFVRDKHEREPFRLLFVSFLLGIFSAVPVLATNYVLGGFESTELADQGDKQAIFMNAFIYAGLIEEFWKFAILMLYAYPKKEFDEPYDGIVYAVMVSMGFATLENVLYVAQGGENLAYLRAFTAIPGHGAFAVLMGYFVGLAKFRNNSLVLKLVGLGSAVLLHGFYDWFLMAQYMPGIWVGAFVALGLGVWLSLRAMRMHARISPHRTK